MQRALLTFVVVVCIASMSSPHPLAPVACSGAIALLAAAPSSSLVENCDFGNQQVAIASNSTVVLRSTVLGGVMFLGGAVVGNVSLTLANCSVVGLANPLDPFLGSYSNVSFTDVAITLQEGTVLRRNNASLQMGGGEGGMLFMLQCNVSSVILILSESRCFTSNLSESALVHNGWALANDNISLLINFSEVSVAGVGVQGVGGGDLLFVQVDAKETNTTSDLDIVNVSVAIVSSVISVLSLSEPARELRLHSVVYHYNIRQHSMFRFTAVDSNFTIGSADSTERVPKWASLLSPSNVHVGSTITIERSEVRLHGSEWAIVIDVEGGSLRNSSVVLKSTFCYNTVRGVTSIDMTQRLSVFVFANTSNSSAFEFVNASLFTQMGIGTPVLQDSLHYLRGYYAVGLRLGEANDSVVNFRCCTISISSPWGGTVEINGTHEASFAAFQIAFCHINCQNSLFAAVHSTRTAVAVHNSSILVGIHSTVCIGLPPVAMLATAILLGSSSNSLRISIADSSVTTTQFSFIGALLVQRFISIVILEGTQFEVSDATSNAGIYARNVTLDASMLNEFAVVALVQLSQAMRSCTVDVESISIPAAPVLHEVTLIIGGDVNTMFDCVIVVSLIRVLPATSSVGGVAFMLMRAQSALNPFQPPLLLLSGCRVALYDTAIDISHRGGGYTDALLPSTVHQADATAWTVRGSSFVGYRRLFNVTPPPSVTVMLEGCDNVWNGRPMRRSDVGAVRSAVSVVQGLEPAGGRHCERLAATVSVSKTAAVSLRVRGGSAVRVAASAASAVGRYAGLLASVSTVASGLAFLSQQASRIAACAAIADDGGDDGAEPPFSDVASNPLQLSFRSLGAGLASAGGCVVSSVVVAVVYFALRCAGVAAERRSKGLPWDAVAVLQLPGSLYGAMMLVLQPVVGAAVALVASPGRSAGSVVLGAIGVCAMSIVPGAYFSWNAIVPWRRRTMPLRIECVDVRRAATSGNCADGVLCERYEWRCALSAGHAYGASSRQVSGEYLGRFAEVLRPYRGGRQWYAAVEVAFGVLSGVVSGAVTALPVSTRCSAGAEIAATAAEGVLLCLAAVSVAVLRPYNAVVGNVLTVGSAAVALVSLVLASSAFGDTVNTVGNALTLAQACLDVVIVVALLCLRSRRFREIDTAEPRMRVSSLANSVTHLKAATTRRKLQLLIELICGTAQRPPHVGRIETPSCTS